jgi:hypothetical protein
LAELEQAGPGFSARAALTSALAREGRTGEARTRLHVLERAARIPSDATDLAAVYVSLGDHSQAVDALEQAYSGKRIWLPVINVEPSFDELRTDARFHDLLRRVGIPMGH